MLVNSGVRFGGGPHRTMGGAQAGAIERGRWATPGALRNLWAGDATVISGASIANRNGYPSGHRHPSSWVMAPKAGGISSRNNALVTLGAAGAGALGLATAGSAAITFGLAGTGGLVVSATGSAALSLAASGNIFAALAAAGSASVSLSAAGAITAPGYLAGSAGITFDGSQTAYAIGWLEGTTANTAELTAEAVAAEVWGALATLNNVAGTMGQKLNGAASAGDPWTTDLPGTYTGAQAGAILAAVQTLIDEIHKLHGLDAAAPLEVTATTRAAGAVTQTIAEAAGTTTVTRVP